MADENVQQTQTGGGTETQTQQTTQTGTTDQKTQSAATVTDTGTKSGTQDDKRDQGILADLKRERQQRQQFEQENTRFRAELEAERRRVQALAGVTPKTKDQTDAEEIRESLGKLYPFLNQLDESKTERLLQLLESSDTIQETVRRTWYDRALQMVESVEKEISDEIGGELTQRQIQASLRPRARGRVLHE